jgi:hypothetical protein
MIGMIDEHNRRPISEAGQGYKGDGVPRVGVEHYGVELHGKLPKFCSARHDGLLTPDSEPMHLAGSGLDCRNECRRDQPALPGKDHRVRSFVVVLEPPQGEPCMAADADRLSQDVKNPFGTAIRSRRILPRS